MKTQIKKPCNKCSTNIKQVLSGGEVYCYLTCLKFKKWQEKQN